MGVTAILKWEPLKYKNPLYKHRKVRIKISKFPKYFNIFLAFIRPVCLPYKQEFNSKSFADKGAFVSGWGKTETKSASNVKMKLSVGIGM